MVASKHRDAFTLVELLVVIGVVALLISILLPALAGARVETKRQKSLTNIRTLATVVQAYCEANKEWYPRPEEHRWYETVDGRVFQTPFWQGHSTWVGVTAAYMPQEGYRQLVHCPDSLSADDKSFPYTSYLYSWSFLSRPEVWRDDPDVSAFTAGTRLSDVLFPSQKGILWDADAGYLRRNRSFIGADLAVSVPVCFVDGSARCLRPSDATAPVVNVYAPSQHPLHFRRILCTRDGVRGIDY